MLTTMGEMQLATSRSAGVRLDDYMHRLTSGHWLGAVTKAVVLAHPLWRRQPALSHMAMLPVYGTLISEFATRRRSGEQASVIGAEYADIIETLTVATRGITPYFPPREVLTDDEVAALLALQPVTAIAEVFEVQLHELTFA